jgi:7-carboxy-7-deazaguanine synthase (Cx14CxxC type)
VKEAYFTLQGEGARTGRPAVFCRFAGCNLWSGREADRAAAVCDFCDTDFVGTDGPGGGKFHAGALAVHLAALWSSDARATGRPYVVFTGGEPLLQLDETLIGACHTAGFEIAIETNGTLPIPPGVDWVCVSPKAGAPCLVQRGDELKLVFPQPGLLPAQVEELDFDRWFLQPMDGPNRQAHTALAEAFVLGQAGRGRPWRLSLQTHKLLGIP